MSIIKDYFNDYNVLRYRKIEVGGIYNLLEVIGFKLKLSSIEVLDKTKKEIKFIDLSTKKEYTLTRDLYRKEWGLNKQMFILPKYSNLL